MKAASALLAAALALACTTSRDPNPVAEELARSLAAEQPRPGTPPIDRVRELWYEETGLLARRWGVRIWPDGKSERHGSDERWFPSGQIQSERCYAGGRPVGHWRTWHENGQLASSVVFDDSGEPREASWWFFDGRLEAHGPTVRGIKSGSWSYFHPGGALRERGEYVAGLREGLWRSWYPDGQPQAEGRYERNRRVGSWRSWGPEEVPAMPAGDRGER